MRRVYRLPIVLTALALFCGVVARADTELDASGWYDLEVKATPKVNKGEAGSLTVHITPKGKAEIHKEAPIKLTLAPPAAVELSKTTLTRSDLKMEGPNASFDVPFTGHEAGKGDIVATVSFYICTDQICAHQERKASLPVTVR